jgi:L-lactate dehydrogenase complex protein LldG
MGSTHSDERTTARAGVLAAFAAKVVLAASDHREVDGWTEVIAELADDADARADRRIAVSPTLVAAEPTLVEALGSAGLQVVVPGPEDPAAEVADVPVGIVRGEIGVAETGSVLVSEHALEDRVVTMLCHRLIQVVHADDVFPRLDDLAAWLSAHRGTAAFVSLMTGPSRTADIERSLTIGVQGPQEVGVRVLTGPRRAAATPQAVDAGDAR